MKLSACLTPRHAYLTHLRAWPHSLLYQLVEVSAHAGSNNASKMKMGSKWHIWAQQLNIKMTALL